MNARANLPVLCLAAVALGAAAVPPAVPVAGKPALSADGVARPSAMAVGVKPQLSALHHSRASVVRPHPASSPMLRPIETAIKAATMEPVPAGFINAAQIYLFSESSLYHVVTAPGQITDIALQPGEVLGAVASGDTLRWVIGDTSSGTGAAKQSHVLVKPIAAGLATSLVITTDRRSYHLQLTSTARTAMAALSWTYPQDQLLAVRRAAEVAEAEAPVAAGIDIAQLHFGYAISGDTPDWRPLRAFDDGRQTFIEFPTSIAVGEAPPLFVVGPKGAVELINYRVRGRYYVVDRLFDVAELRLGLRHQEVVRVTHTAELADKRRGA